jgi:UDP-glucose 4-epimerase
MKALVTGGAGFVGHYLVKELLKNGIETVVFDISDRDADNFDHNRFQTPICIKGDILDFNQLMTAMKGCNLVFHTAAIADIDEARKDPQKTIRVNVEGTVNCLEAAKLNNVQRFLYASSVYASGNRGSFYRVSKQSGESLCKTYYEEFGLQYTILRYGSLYGREPNHWNFIYSVCKELLTKGEYHYTSSPEAIREYIHISDAARETVRIALSEDFINKCILITGHQRLKMKEFFEMVEEMLGKEIKIFYAPEKRPRHYIRTPYAIEYDVPLRVNLSTYIDISEGILDCLKEVQVQINETENTK